MKICSYFKKHLLVVFILVFLSASFIVNKNNKKPFVFISKQESSLNLDNTLLMYFNLGCKRIISSTLWISTILESDIEHYRSRDLNSWMFLRFNTISQLEPEFYENYAFGAPYLSIIKDDLEGASFLYKKGLHYYPNNYALLKNAAFHFYFEVKELKTAYELLKRLNQMPGRSPVMLGALSRLEAEKGNLRQAYLFLTDMQSKFSPDSLVGKKIYDYRYSIKAEEDLNCLNKGLNNCSMIDLDNTPYIKTKNGFAAQKPWTPYRPRWRK